MSTATPEVAEPVLKEKTRKLPPYNVVLLNDDDHSFDYVIAMLQQLFGYPREKGYQMAYEVHTQGRVIVCTTSLERAELKRDQIPIRSSRAARDRCPPSSNRRSDESGSHFLRPSGGGAVSFRKEGHQEKLAVTGTRQSGSAGLLCSRPLV
jgi:ATP-dependent Clp protease adaptor protein ClpS